MPGMDAPDPPIVWLPHLGHGAAILAWIRRPDGWWAHLSCTSLTPSNAAGFEREAIPLYHWTVSVHESRIQPRQGVDYSAVPRIT